MVYASGTKSRLQLLIIYEFRKCLLADIETPSGEDSREFSDFLTDAEITFEQWSQGPGHATRQKSPTAEEEIPLSLDDFVRLYPNFVSPERCRELLRKYEDVSQTVVVQTRCQSLPSIKLSSPIVSGNAPLKRKRSFIREKSESGSPTPSPPRKRPNTRYRSHQTS